jgi:hypothetical protein
MGLAALCLAGPAVIYGFRSANVHLLLVLMTLAAIVAWGQGQRRRAALLIAAAGAIKVFPLFLVPVLVALREWRLVTRIAVLSAGLWLLPFVWFGPARGLELYRQWERDVARNVERLRLESRLDVSLGSTAARWLSEVDYTQRIDPRYPQANLARLAPLQARAIGQGLVILVASLTLLAALKLGGSMADPTSRAAAAGSLFATAQLLIGPYTTLLYLSAWIVPAVGLPAAAAIQLSVRRRLRAALGLLGAATLTLALLPGSASHRAVEAWGAHTLLTAALWALSLWLAWRFPRKRELSPA